MQIVKQLRGQGWAYELSSHFDGGDVAVFGRGEYDRCDDEWEEHRAALAPTPARAIGLAAWEVYQKETSK